jgi:hypothetical protein
MYRNLSSEQSTVTQDQDDYSYSNQNFEKYPVQPSAIERFQKFLKRNSKMPPHGPVKVCIQPEIAPEIMAAITVLYNKQYGFQSLSPFFPIILK